MALLTFRQRNSIVFHFSQWDAVEKINSLTALDSIVLKKVFLRVFAKCECRYIIAHNDRDDATHVQSAKKTEKKRYRNSISKVNLEHRRIHESPELNLFRVWSVFSSIYLCVFLYTMMHSARAYRMRDSDANSQDATRSNIFFSFWDEQFISNDADIWAHLKKNMHQASTKRSQCSLFFSKRKKKQFLCT